VVRDEEKSCILVLLLPSEGEAAGLWLPLSGDWRGGAEVKGILLYNSQMDE